MNKPKEHIWIQSDGRIDVCGEEARQWVVKHAGQYLMTSSPPGLLIMRRLPEGDRDVGPRVLMTGEVASRMTILEIINMIAASNWCGELHVYSDDSHRMLGFDQGALKTATSNVQTEKLGEILASYGIITQDQLVDCVLGVNEERRFGQVVVEEGYINREQLFQHLRIQLEKIFYATLLVNKGSYAFIQPDENADPPAMTFHVPVQSLLMEGVQRIDEMEMFRERISSIDMCPIAISEVVRKSLNENLKPVVRLVDGKRSIRAISRDLGWDEFETTKAVYNLLQQGYLEVHAPREIENRAVSHLVSKFNEIMREVFDVVIDYGGVEEMHKTLTLWMHGSGFTKFFGEFLGDKGEVDPEQVIAALQSVYLERPMEELHQAFQELVSYALFAASPTLPRMVEQNLVKKVKQLLEKLRL